MFTHSNAPKCSNLHNNRFDSGGIYDAKGWSLCKGKNRLDHPNNHEQTGCHKVCLASLSGLEKDLSDTSFFLYLCQHLHGCSPGVAPENVSHSPEKRSEDGDSSLNASDHLCQCHHCVCHHGMKPPRQATQWGGGSAEGAGNKL